MDLAAPGAIEFNDFQAWWRMRMMFTKADVAGEVRAHAPFHPGACSKWKMD